MDSDIAAIFIAESCSRNSHAPTRRADLSPRLVIYRPTPTFCVRSLNSPVCAEGDYRLSNPSQPSKFKSETEPKSSRSS
jgi:hypothetical protein